MSEGGVGDLLILQRELDEAGQPLEMNGAGVDDLGLDELVGSSSRRPVNSRLRPCRSSSIGRRSTFNFSAPFNPVRCQPRPR